MTTGEHDNARRFPRATVVMEVRYRSTGSFLVSYSLNLSKGGLFLETDDLLPLGTKIPVRFTVPNASAPVETMAQVIWRREVPSADGMPRGLGLQFDELESNIGAQIDALVRDFGGVRMAAVAGDTPSLARLAQYLRSIINCEVSQHTARQVSEAGFSEVPDLVLLDLDSAGDEGLRAITLGLHWKPNVPTVAVSRIETTRLSAAKAGAAAVLENPPPFKKLRRCILEVLARPAARQG
jgi:uncharacterized protein (TIGR02266 family)